MLSVDNSWFTLLTQNMNPIHFDHAYAAQTEFGKPLVDSTFTLALVTGQSTIDLSFNVMANLGWDEVRLPNPLFEGDTVYSRSEVLEKRESKSRPNVGIVKVKTTGFKQDGNDRDRVPPHVHGLQARTRAGERPHAHSGASKGVIREIDVASTPGCRRAAARRGELRHPAGYPRRVEAPRSSREPSPLGRQTLEQLVRNYEVAAAERVPVCQDSGVAVVMLDIGQDVHFVGGVADEAVHAGVREGTRTGYLRSSVTGDPPAGSRWLVMPAPAAIHIELVPGDRPAAPRRVEGLRSREHERAAHACACGRSARASATSSSKPSIAPAPTRVPPIIVGVGIGGTFEGSALLAKRAVLRPIDRSVTRGPISSSSNRDLLQRVNGLGIGPQGFGGRTTALAVNIEAQPTHIAGLPVAVNLGCHSTRRAEIEL